MMESPEPDVTSNPRPRLTVCIGITGHRRIPAGAEEALRRRVAAFLQFIKDETDYFIRSKEPFITELYAAAPPRFVLLSSLAAGADSLVAQEALALDYELQVPLPLARQEYERDFEGDELLTFRELLGRASRVFEIGAANPERSHAYADAARVLLNYSDLLLALWDGKDTGYVAGTSATIELASALHIPTMHLPTEEALDACVIKDGFRVPQWQLELRHYLASLLLPTEVAPQEKRGFVRFCVEAMAPRSERRKGQRFARSFSGQKKLPGWKYVHLEKLMTNALLRLFGRPEYPELPRAAGDNKAFPAHNGELLQRWQGWFCWFDGLSNDYSGIYRSFLVLKYICPVLALVALTVGLYLPECHPAGKEAVSLGMMVPFFIAQGIFLLFPALLSLGDKRCMLHRKFFSYRVVSEQLRQTCFLSPVGFLNVRRQESACTSTRQRWTAWYYRALMRQDGLPHVRVDRGYLSEWVAWVRNDFVVGQMGYHSRRVVREGNISVKLQRFGFIFFLLGIAAAIARGSLVCGTLDCGEDYKLAKAMAGAAAVMFPALAVFFTGFCAYAGYSKNRQVSMDGCNSLDAIRDELDRTLPAAPAGAGGAGEPGYTLPEELHFSRVYGIAEQIDSCCRGELMGWEDVIRAKDIKFHG